MAAGFLTFSNAERVVATGHKIVERNKQVGVILAGSSQQVLLGVPASCFCQTLTLEVWPLQSFWKTTAELVQLDDMHFNKLWAKASRKALLWGDWRSVAVSGYEAEMWRFFFPTRLLTCMNINWFLPTCFSTSCLTGSYKEAVASAVIPTRTQSSKPDHVTSCVPPVVITFHFLDYSGLVLFF